MKPAEKCPKNAPSCGKQTCARQPGATTGDAPIPVKTHPQIPPLKPISFKEGWSGDDFSYQPGNWSGSRGLSRKPESASEITAWLKEKLDGLDRYDPGYFFDTDEEGYIAIRNAYTLLREHSEMLGIEDVLRPPIDGARGCEGEGIEDHTYGLYRISMQTYLTRLLNLVQTTKSKTSSSPDTTRWLTPSEAMDRLRRLPDLNTYRPTIRVMRQRLDVLRKHGSIIYKVQGAGTRQHYLYDLSSVESHVDAQELAARKKPSLRL